ncbi:unnamed protein product [Durusdinium trenchii]|uniref:Uncharacterized protein n=2 Tax=Durusdinium trenchii TaxID=1381693 RepID=A0ABP0MME8_9DINO
MVARVCLVLSITCSLHLPFILEQPSSSLMELHPAFRWLSKQFKIYRIFVWLGAYGGGSPKGTWLYSNYKELLSPLYLPLPKDKVWDAEMSTKILVLTKRHQKTICIMSVNSDGTLSVSGGKDLKTSQHYPILFGRTVAEVVMQNHESIYNNVYKRRRGLQSYPSTKNPSTTFNGYPVLDVL